MKKLILSMILIFFVSISTVRVYGYYDDSSTQYLSETETKIKITEKIQSSNGMDLVPTGAILGVNDTEEIVFTYKVFIQEGIDFQYYIQNITINDEVVSEDLMALFNFDFEVNHLQNEKIQVDLFDEALNGNYVEITVTLSMNFPTQEQYFMVAGQQLEFEFSVETVL